MKLLSVVVSVYNEEAAIDAFNKAACEELEKLTWGYEIIYVNDGSRDSSYAKLKRFAEENEHITVLNFSRNFGHEAAMIAGIDYSKGDGVICMDADLQHPVEKIPEIVDAFEQGYEVITMKRMQNKSAGLLKNVTSGLFYKILNKLSNVKFEENASDFFALSKEPANVLRKEYRERVRFLRGYVQSLGYNNIAIEYEAKDRVAGASKYNLKKLFAFSINALLSFSNTPLKFASICGVISGLLGVIVMLYTIFTKVAYGTPNGYATIIVVICFMFAMLFLVLGVIGEYIGIIFTEIKERPMYIIRNVYEKSQCDDEKNN